MIEGQQESLLLDKKVEEKINLIGNNGFIQNQLLILGPCLAADAIEVTLFGYVLNIIELNGELLSSNPFLSGIISSTVFVGMLLGDILCGYISDKFGRKQILTWCLTLNFFAAIMSASTLLVSQSIQLYWLIISRFLAGFGASGTMPAAFSLAVEISPSALKIQAVNLLEIFWALGLIFVGVVAYCILSEDVIEQTSTGKISYHHWPWFILVASIPAGVTAVLAPFLIEESVVYLEKNKKNCPKIPIILAKMNSTKLKEGERNILSLLPPLPQPYSPVNHQEVQQDSSMEANHKKTMMNSLKKLVGVNLRVIFFRLIISSFCVYFALYGLSSWVSVVYGKLGFNTNPYFPSVFFATAAFPGNFVAIYLLPKVGPFKVMMYTLILSILCLLLSLINSSVLIIVGTAGFRCLISAASNILDALSASSFPTSVKGVGFGVTSASGRVGGIVAGFLNGYLLSSNDEGGFKLILMNAAILFVAIFVLSGVKHVN